MSTTLNRINPENRASAAELAELPFVRDCFQWFARERQWINERHLELCRIPAPTFLEAKRAEWMLGQFKALGYDAKVDRGGNVVSHYDPSHRGPLVALTAHLDTVLAPRLPDDVKVDVDGTLRGPGVSDNGAGLAALLAIASVLRTLSGANRHADLLAPLIFVANVGEEGEGNLSGMRYVCRQSSLATRIRSFVVLDGPTTAHITHQALASRRFEVNFSGSGGHSWSDFGAGNPVHALGRAISIFVDQANAATKGSRASYNFGTIEGGSSINSIATQARAKLDIRSDSPDLLRELVEALTRSVEQALQTENDRSTAGKLVAKVKELGSRPGGSLPADSPLLGHLRSIDKLLNIRSYLDCASTDANIPLSMNLEALSIGAGGKGGGAHTPNEWFHPEGRDLGLKRILLLLLLSLNER